MGASLFLSGGGRVAWSLHSSSGFPGFKVRFAVVIFAVPSEEEMAMRLRWKMRWVTGGLVVLATVAALDGIASAQADYPFRDPKLSDDQRIADLLSRVTLAEKVDL